MNIDIQRQDTKLFWEKIYIDHRRKLRKLTSDNKLKSRLEKSSQKKEDQHARRVTRNKIHTRQMLGKSRITVFFQ